MSKVIRLLELFAFLMMAIVFGLITIYIWDNDSWLNVWICLFTFCISIVSLIKFILWFRFNIVMCPECKKLSWSNVYYDKFSSGYNKTICCGKCGYKIRVFNYREDPYDQDSMP